MEIEQDITKRSTVELIADFTIFEQQIDMLTIKHEEIRKELIRRFPMIEDNEEFKSKIKAKK